MLYYLAIPLKFPDNSDYYLSTAISCPDPFYHRVSLRFSINSLCLP